MQKMLTAQEKELEEGKAKTQSGMTSSMAEAASEGQKKVQEGLRMDDQDQDFQSCYINQQCAFRNVPVTPTPS